MADSRRRLNSYKNAKRRAEAISFLSNISLSGRSERAPNGTRGHNRKRNRADENIDQKDDEGLTSVLGVNSHIDSTSTSVTVSVCNVRSNVMNSKSNVNISDVVNIANEEKTVSFTPSPLGSSSGPGKHKASLSILHHTEVTETPKSTHKDHSISKIRKSYSTSRTRRSSGGVQTTPPSSPTKGSERFFPSRSFSSDPRFLRQLPSDPALYRSTYPSSEELQHAIAVKKLSSLESPPEGSELDFRRSRVAHMYSNGSRVVLVSNHKAPIAIWSHLRYNRSSQFGFPRRDSEGVTRTRVGSIASRPHTMTVELDVEQSPSFMEGVLLGAEGKTVSYSHMLVPSLILTSQGQQRLAVPGNMLAPSPVAGITERDGDVVTDLVGQYTVYDPTSLDDPELISGKHKKLFQFASYRVSVIDYAKPSTLKRDINEQFRARYPRIEITLSKLRSIKREMKAIILDECELDPGVLAHSFVYFEKLVLFEKINKENRKLLAGVCLILSAKMNDIKGAELDSLVKEIESTFRENQKDLFAFEFPVLVALEFALHIPVHEVMPHYVRLMQT